LLLISEYYPPRIFGGGEVSALQLARGLAGRGFEVWVLTSGAAGLAEEESVDGVRVVRRLVTGPSPHSHWNNVRRVLRLPPSIRREAERLTAARDFDAVFLLGATTVVPLRLPAPTVAVINFFPPFCPKGTLYFQERGECDGCAPGKFVPCIVRSEHLGNNRMPWFLRYNPAFWQALYLQYLRRRRGLRGIDAFVAISGFVEQVLHRHGIPPERIVRIYNVAEIEDGDAVPRDLAPVLAGRRVVTFLGKLEKVKGPELAVRGFAAWRSGDDLLLLAGEGSLRRPLEALCERLGIVDAVHFAGQVPAKYLPWIYRSSYAVVLPSQWPEPFSRIVMEAAYFRRPLLASDRGGNRDLPAEHLFSTPGELAEKLERPPVPDFAPYRPAANLDRFVELVRRLGGG
jgi:glycosyltransferase involved in cell wall biosynthesis